MPNLGMGELVLLFLIVLLIFGARRLPQIADGVSKAIRTFKRGLNSDDDICVTPGQDNADDAAVRPQVPSGETPINSMSSAATTKEPV